MILFRNEGNENLSRTDHYFSPSVSRQDLPEPVPVSGAIPQELFGDCMLLLEFLHAFGEELGVNEDFPDGMNLGNVSNF